MAERTVTIGLLGPQASGKTIFLACLLDSLNGRTVTLAGQKGTLSIDPQRHKNTSDWLEARREQIAAGRLPPGTEVPIDLYLTFTPTLHGMRATVFRFRDYRGGQFQEPTTWAFADGAAPEKDGLKASGQREAISIHDILKSCQAVILLVDTDAVVTGNTTQEIPRYVRAVIEIARLRPWARIPVQLLFSKSDMHPEVREEELLTKVKEITAHLADTSVTRLRPPAFFDFGRSERFTSVGRVSCVRTIIVGGETRIAPAPSGIVFQPQRVAGAFETLATQTMRMQRLRRKYRAATAAVLLAFIGTASAYGAVLKEQSEYRQLRAAFPGLADAQAADLASAFSRRWGHPLARPLALWVGDDVAESRSLEASARAAVRKRVYDRAIHAAGAESAHDVHREHESLYSDCKRDIELYLDAYGSDAYLESRRDIYDEKLRVLRAMTELEGVPAAEVGKWVDDRLARERFPVFARLFYAYKADIVTNLAKADEYRALVRRLPDATRASVEDLTRAIDATTQWLVKQRHDDNAGETLIRDVAQRRRTLQLALVDLAYQMASRAAPSSDHSAALAVWERFIAVYSSNPVVPPTSDEGRAWSSRIAEGRRKVAGLREVIATQERLAQQQQRRERARQLTAGLLAENGPLTNASNQRFKDFLAEFGREDEYARQAARVRQRWEALAIEEVKSAYERYTSAKSEPALATLADAHRRYESLAAEFPRSDRRRSYIDAVAQFVAWARQPGAVRLEIYQTGRMYVQIIARGRQHDTRRREGPISIELPRIAVTERFIIRFLNDDRLGDTLVAEVETDLLSIAGSMMQAYRGSQVRIVLAPARPVLPDPGL